MEPRFKYFIAYKPYGMLTQFTDSEGRRTLSDLYPFPPEVYAVGRLDMDSEGLILLTNDKKLNFYLLNPQNAHEREYFAQVEGIPKQSDLGKLEKGVIIEGRKTLPARAKLLNPAPEVPERIPPIRERKNIPTSWISLRLIEGKNRQVRKMTAHIGFPTLRLIRVSIGKIKLGSLRPGQVKEIKIKSYKDII
ncbi:MAG: pseudouridine synthase [Ignavibacteria bacterium]|jgi:23S rRNA pseudouridine2457 synthase|nr:pseudouridine synthase [Ignavibacteria bacterium]